MVYFLIFYHFTQSLFYLYALAASFAALLSFLSKNFFTPSSLFFVLVFLPCCLFYFDSFVSFFSNLYSQLSSFEHFLPVFFSFLFSSISFFLHSSFPPCNIYLPPLLKLFLVFIFFYRRTVKGSKSNISGLKKKLIEKEENTRARLICH